MVLSLSFILSASFTWLSVYEPVPLVGLIVQSEACCGVCVSTNKRFGIGFI